MSCGHELANEWARCSGKNASYITILVVVSDWLTFGFCGRDMLHNRTHEVSWHPCNVLSPRRVPWSLTSWTSCNMSRGQNIPQTGVAQVWKKYQFTRRDMWLQHIPGTCTCNIPGTCPCYTSLLHVPATRPCYTSLLHVPARCPCYTSLLHVPTTRPWYMSLLHVPATRPCYTSLLHVPATCPCYMSPLYTFLLHFPATCSRYTSLQHVASVCVTHVFVASTCDCNVTSRVWPPLLDLIDV